jgi:hypothetical protein
MKGDFMKYGIAIIVSIILTACNSSELSITETPTLTIASARTSTPTSTSTPTPTPTPEFPDVYLPGDHVEIYDCEGNLPEEISRIKALLSSENNSQNISELEKLLHSDEYLISYGVFLTDEYLEGAGYEPILLSLTICDADGAEDEVKYRTIKLDTSLPHFVSWSEDMKIASAIHERMHVFQWEMVGEDYNLGNSFNVCVNESLAQDYSYHILWLMGDSPGSEVDPFGNHRGQLHQIASSGNFVSLHDLSTWTQLDRGLDPQTAAKECWVLGTAVRQDLGESVALGFWEAFGRLRDPNAAMLEVSNNSFNFFDVLDWGDLYIQNGGDYDEMPGSTN